MDLFNREDLKRLAGVQDAPCITIFMPTVRFESDQSQNPIRYKNMLKQVREQLSAQDYSDQEIEKLLREAQQQLDKTAFWRAMSEGLAVFISPSFTNFYRLPLSLNEVVVVGERFHLKPLFPLIATNNRYYVLTLSKKDVRLYQGTHYALNEVSSTGIPANIQEAIRQYEDPEESLQQHTSNRTYPGRQDATFHGQGITSDDRGNEAKNELKRFFREIDRTLCERLQDESAPLILAGVAEYLPYYRTANQYPHLVDDQIVGGNPEHLHPKELHEQSWSLVEPIFLKAQKQALERFNDLFHMDGDLASEDFHEIIPACAFSRVDTLFVPIGHHRWGYYQSGTNEVGVHDEQQPGDEDLLNYAAIQAYLNGSTVYALRPENMPNGFSLAATFRFAADVTASEQ